MFVVEVLMKLLENQQVDGYIWKLKKPLYGLDDASRKFWLKVKETLVVLGLKMIPGDETCYYLHEQ